MLIRRLLSFFLLLYVFNGNAQNVGIGITIPAEKLHIDSGHVKIGRIVLGSGQSNLLKFGDGNFVTIGESDADDQMSLTASYFLFRSNGGFGGRVGINVPSGVPTAQLEVNGSVKITDGLQGTGKIFTSDASGLASWQAPASGSGAFKGIITGAAFNVSSGSATSLIFTGEEYDDNSAFFTGTYSVPSSGLYHFDVHVVWDITAVPFNTQYSVALLVGGAQVHSAYMQVPANIGSLHTQEISCDIRLTGGQTVSLSVNQNSGGLQPIWGSGGASRYTYFSGRRVN